MRPPEYLVDRSLNPNRRSETFEEHTMQLFEVSLYEARQKFEFRNVVLAKNERLMCQFGIVQMADLRLYRRKLLTDAWVACSANWSEANCVGMSFAINCN